MGMVLGVPFQSPATLLVFQGQGKVAFLKIEYDSTSDWSILSDMQQVQIPGMERCSPLRLCHLLPYRHENLVDSLREMNRVWGLRRGRRCPSPPRSKSLNQR